MKEFFCEWLRASIKGVIPFLVFLIVILVSCGAFALNIGFGLAVMVFMVIIYCAFLGVYMDFWRRW